MSRTAWAALLFLGAAVGLVAYLMTRPLPTWVQDDVAATLSAMDNQATAETQALQSFDEIIAKDPAFLADLPEITAARASLEKRIAEHAALRKQFADDVEPLVAKDRHRDWNSINEKMQALRLASTAIVPGVPSPIRVAQQTLDFKLNHAQLMADAEARVEGARLAASLDEMINARVNAALVECPEATSLKTQLAASHALRDGLVADGTQLAAEKAKATPDYLASGRLAQSTEKRNEAWQKSRADLEATLSTLKSSEEKVLVDMKKENSRYFHKYTTYLDGTPTTGVWEPVTFKFYNGHVRHLGMAIASKPECTPYTDRLTVASPPGYNYIGNPRYGQWENRNGGSYWVFYGRYSLMRDLMWGHGRYRPVRRSTWNNYDRSRRSRTAWFGEKNQYGTRGTTTRQRYSSSKYLNSRAPSRTTSGPARSGGTGYSGSKYKGTSGRRSGGYRSSGSRSRSFGGSGK